MTAAKASQQVPRCMHPDAICLFLDVDGTLLDIAPRPEAVEVQPRLLDDLAAVERATGGALALVSGRLIADLDELFAPLRLAAAGVHGAEMRLRPEGPVTRLAEGRLGDEAWQALLGLLCEFPGSYAEHKTASFAVHYGDPGTDIRRLRGALSTFIGRLSRPDAPLHLVAGKAVFEIQLTGFDKGRAIRCFMAGPPFCGRQPVFIGDDELDRPAFDTALELGGMAYSVGGELPGVSGVFAAPAEVRAWLRGLAR
jgi:trehalose 6-phosphate phosphatase